MIDFLIAPFGDFAFMRRALVGTLAIAVAAAPIGVFLTLRRMSLTGDAIAHGILPGAAAGYLVAGLSLPALSIGGFVAGITVALAAAFVARVTIQREDASLAAFYLISLAGGVLLVSLRGNSLDLQAFLFGSPLALDDSTLIMMAGVTIVVLAGVALLFRPLLMESFDPGFLRHVSSRAAMVHIAFLVLAVLTLVAGFHALGTLLAVGIMILPAATARFWARSIGPMIAIAMAVAAGASGAGLLLSYHFDIPASPAIILTAGLAYALSFGLGRHGSIRARR